eukprot:1879629-Pyramimonas_sp.AAC.1
MSTHGGAAPSVAHSQGVASVAPARQQKGCPGDWGAVRRMPANCGKRSVSSAPIGGAEGVGALRVARLQNVAGVALHRHRKRCAKGGGA